MLVAASVGPYGACLADGSEYTGRYGVPASRLRDFHGPRLELLAEAGPDLLAVETIPDVDEAEVLIDLLEGIDVPAWFSYSVRGETTAAGQSLTDAYAVLAGHGSLIAAGVNCSEQSDVLGAVRAAVAATGLPAVAYPNRGGTWDAQAKQWSYGDPLDLDLVSRRVRSEQRSDRRLLSYPTAPMVLGRCASENAARAIINTSLTESDQRKRTGSLRALPRFMRPAHGDPRPPVRQYAGRTIGG